MDIKVTRFVSDNDATLSLVSIDGEFQCFGLEDEFRLNKIHGETRIPAGKYKVGIRDVGGFHGRYLDRFPLFHKGMLQVLDVPGFDYILIHIGNTDEDTAGCLLVGAGCNSVGEMTISSSSVAYSALYKKVCISAREGNLSIEYVDND